jgi:hypothetical protein
MMVQNVKVIDRGWNRIVKNHQRIQSGLAVSVGIQGSQAEADHGGATNVTVGAVHEYGAPKWNIPERSYMRSTFDEGLFKYERALQKVAKTFFVGIPVEGELLLLGEFYRKDIIDKIKQGLSPSWADSTAAQKAREGKSGDPILWDTGQLVNSLIAVVVEFDKKRFTQ